ncbi:hypothetical protein QR680_014510 [Steinernema hermaphroditum]|uniref:Peptidase S1 domain-containing protein n=1 Tax=Steinernema hermaphroditum TaxID=289476 RepID=A0AA39IAJ1_9BILA|nr:hypothetical protein QR680_014510 [Steinernema hermaphroditum]
MGILPLLFLLIVSSVAVPLQEQDDLHRPWHTRHPRRSPPTRSPIEMEKELEMTEFEQLFPKSEFIFGGKPAKAGDIPIQALIVAKAKEGHRFYCGGSLISKKHVLTAAYCGLHVKSAVVILGAADLKDHNTQQSRRATKIIIHPDFGKSKDKFDNDIAILQLEKDVEINKNVRIVQLSLDDSKLEKNARAVVSGFGVFDEKKHGLSPVLRAGEVKIVENEVCTKAFELKFNDNQICAKGKGSAPGPGDGGGPLFVNHDGGLIQLGIASFGGPYDPKGEPELVFTRVSRYCKWIAEKTGKEANCNIVQLLFDNEGGSVNEEADESSRCDEHFAQEPGLETDVPESSRAFEEMLNEDRHVFSICNNAEPEDQQASKVCAYSPYIGSASSGEMNATQRISLSDDAAVGIGAGSNIMVRLGKIYLLGSVQFTILDGDEYYYHYFVEVSTDKKNWEMVNDNRNSKCRSVQEIFFKKRPVKYIRIVPTYTTYRSRNAFRIDNFTCPSDAESLRARKEKIKERIFHDPYVLCQWGLENRHDVFVPIKGNITSVSVGAEVIIEGEAEGTQNWILNGYLDYMFPPDSFQGVTIGNGNNITVKLGRIYMLDLIRLQLWSFAFGFYRYYVEVSIDGRDYDMISDNRNSDCRGWQNIMFKRRPVKFIRMVGTYNSESMPFRIAVFECPLKVEKQSTATFSEDRIALFEDPLVLGHWGLHGRKGI